MKEMTKMATEQTIPQTDEELEITMNMAGEINRSLDRAGQLGMNPSLILKLLRGDLLARFSNELKFLDWAIEFANNHREDEDLIVWEAKFDPALLVKFIKL